MVLSKVCFLLCGMRIDRIDVGYKKVPDYVLLISPSLVSKKSIHRDQRHYISSKFLRVIKRVEQ